jgi:hypothetical protein
VSNRSRLTLLILPAALAGCSFSMSAGGPDYAKLESAITDELNGSYQKIDREVSEVACEKPEKAPKAGDTFLCNADVDGSTVRVQVVVSDDEENVEFSTLDVIFDLSQTAQGLTKEISADRGFAVTVTCGEGLKVVEVGESFECTAADRRGDTRPVKVTPGGVDEDDRWELIGVN